MVPSSDLLNNIHVLRDETQLLNCDNPGTGWRSWKKEGAELSLRMMGSVSMALLSCPSPQRRYSLHLDSATVMRRAVS